MWSQRDQCIEYIMKGVDFLNTIEILHHNSTKEWLSAAPGASVSSGDLPGQGGHHDALCNSRGQRYRAQLSAGDRFGRRAGGAVDREYRGERTIESRADRDMECAARYHQTGEVQGP